MTGRSRTARRAWGITRRGAIGLVLGTVAALSGMARAGDEGPGRIFTYSVTRIGTSRTFGVFATDPGSGTWRQLPVEGYPYMRVSPDGRAVTFTKRDAG